MRQNTYADIWPVDYDIIPDKRFTIYNLLSIIRVFGVSWHTRTISTMNNNVMMVNSTNSSVLIQMMMYVMNQSVIQEENSYNYYYMNIGKGRRGLVWFLFVVSTWNVWFQRRTRASATGVMVASSYHHRGPPKIDRYHSFRKNYKK